VDAERGKTALLKEERLFFGSGFLDLAIVLKFKTILLLASFLSLLPILLYQLSLRDRNKKLFIGVKT